MADPKNKPGDFERGVMDIVNIRPLPKGPTSEAYRAGTKAHGVQREIEVQRAVDRALASPEQEKPNG